jgi:hypothetical protein
MKTVKNGIIVAVCYLFIGGGFSYAEDTREASQLRGRDIAEIGKIVTVSGILKKEGVEWVLLSSDSEYDIHLGPESYRDSKGFQLVEGERAVVKGFHLKTDIAVMEIGSNDKTIVLRDSSGRPAWSGSRFARGLNSDADHDHDGHNHGSDSSIEVPKDVKSLDDLGGL